MLLNSNFNCKEGDVYTVKQFSTEVNDEDRSAMLFKSYDVNAISEKITQVEDEGPGQKQIYIEGFDI